MYKHLQIAGLTPLSTVDYPHLLASVIYTQGCPLRCGYCHNPHLIPAKKTLEELSWESVMDFLKQRVGFLQGVVFSGGEPTLQGDLPHAMCEVRRLGFKLGLHTSGVYPKKLIHLMPYLDWVGLDVKALPEHYDRVCGRRGQAYRVDESLSILQSSGCAYEVRITAHPLDFDEEMLRRLIERVSRLGVQVCVIQVARGGQTLNRAYSQIKSPFDMNLLYQIVDELKVNFQSLSIREG